MQKGNYLNNRFFNVKSLNLKTKIILIIMAVILIAGLILMFQPSQSNKKLPIYKTKFSPFKEFLAVNGVLEAESSVSIEAPPMRYMYKVIYLIPEGTLVKKGDIIAEFDVSSVQERIEENELVLENYDYEMEDMKQSQIISMNNMEDKLKSAEDNLRISVLKSKASIYASEVNKQTTEINVEKSKTAVEQAKRDIEDQKLKNQIDLRKLNNKILSRKKKLVEYKDDIKNFQVTAPSQGIVIYPYWGKRQTRVKVAEGDSLYYGRRFAILPDLTKMMVNIQINEVEINRIRFNQKVHIILDSYKERSYTGYIKHIARIADEDRDNELIKNFECLVKVNDVDIDHLKPGISAVCNITISTLSRVIAIPIESVFRDKDDKSICFVVEKNNIEIKKVDLGPRNENYIVVNNGLTTNEIVFLINPLEEKNAFQEYKINEYIELEKEKDGNEPDIEREEDFKEEKSERKKSSKKMKKSRNKR